ncbi:MAG: hypothetical protein GEU79_07055 [Acidimicrobiia bacterium]|nr:hypothetical protein [Acidimicrobiia bacterium]
MRGEPSARWYRNVFGFSFAVTLGGRFSGVSGFVVCGAAATVVLEEDELVVVDGVVVEGVEVVAGSDALVAAAVVSDVLPSEPVQANSISGNNNKDNRRFASGGTWCWWFIVSPAASRCDSIHCHPSSALALRTDSILCPP